MANENLPNIVNTLSDGNLDSAITVDLGDSLLVIGTSQKGPINQPVAITSPAEAEEVFGTYTIGNIWEFYMYGNLVLLGKVNIAEYSQGIANTLNVNVNGGY